MQQKLKASAFWTVLQCSIFLDSDTISDKFKEKGFKSNRCSGYTVSKAIIYIS